MTKVVNLISRWVLELQKHVGVREELTQLKVRLVSSACQQVLLQGVLVRAVCSSTHR